MTAAQIQPSSSVNEEQYPVPVTRKMASQQHVHDSVSSTCPNPAPLGLIAFGFTTGLLQVKHARFGGSNSEELRSIDVNVMGFALFFGGLLQILAGQNEIRRNNLFGYTAFSVYGGFWMSIGIIKFATLLATDTSVTSSHKATEGVLFMLAVISIMFWTLTFTMNKTICSLFGLLCVTVILLAFGVQNETADQVGGYFGVATSVNAIWLAYAELVNTVIGKGREIIPLGKLEWKSIEFNVATNSNSPIQDPDDLEGGTVNIQPTSS